MYALIHNQIVEKFPYSIGDLRKDNPNISFPKKPSDALLAEYGVLPVQNAPEPSYDSATQTVSWGTPEQVNGVWTHTWIINTLSAEEQQNRAISAANDVRAERNTLLSSSDWTQVADAPVDQAAWATYRQALRDITAQAGFPWSVNWPVAP